MIKKIFEIGGVILFYCWGKFFAGENLQPELFGMAIGGAYILLVELACLLYEERMFLRLYFNCFVLKRNSPLRLSIAYIYKIESQGKYLLVKNGRFDTPTYQPVGGVYKYFYPEATKTLNEMSIVTDNAIDNDDASEYDLRLKMTKRKNIRKFIRWFFNSDERESDPWREFFEELVKPKFLSRNDFNYISYNLVGQHFEPIHHDSYFKIDTFKYVDIYTPRFITQKQKDKLKQLLNNQNEDFIWATEEEIQKKFSKDGKRISDHAHKIFYTKKLK